MTKRKIAKYNSQSVVNAQKRWKNIAATADIRADATWKGKVGTSNLDASTYVTAKGQALDLSRVEAGTRNNLGGASVSHNFENNKTTVSAQKQHGRTGVGARFTPQDNALIFSAQTQFGRTGVGAAYDSRGNRIDVNVQKNILGGQGQVRWNSQDKDIRAMYYRNFSLGK